MTERHDFLVEIGTEELPAANLLELVQAFSAQLEAQLQKAELQFAAITQYATPRRLALRVSGLAAAQPSRWVERKGPALSAAYDASGNPTPACIGFARSCGANIDQLHVEETAKGAWLVYRYEQPGETAVHLLPKLVEQTINQLPIPRPMRWGSQTARFLRPVHWLVMLLDDKVIETELFGIQTTRETRGHRFLHPQPLAIPHAKDYAELLYTQGQVIADFAQRRKVIHEQLQAIAADKGTVIIDTALLDEVTGLVEWPVALLAHFSPQFLAMPAEVLTTAMKQHQKSFAVIDKQQQLLPYFITVANLISKNPQRVIMGNERVMRARLADAAFFYQLDSKQRLESRVENLKTVIFQQKLGSVYAKVQRVAQLGAHIVKAFNADSQLICRAALLAKADLLSAMVGEFPELQGIMGYYYALQDGESPAVASAIKEHYLPRTATDQLPETLLGCVLAIADRLDTLIGIFGIHQAPSGDKDPFGLRRAALAVLRIIIQQQFPLDLQTLLQQAHQTYQASLPNPDAIAQTLTFIYDRLPAWYAEQGIPADVLAAVLARNPTQPWDLQQRIAAVQHFKQLPQAASLAAANKRVSNILKKEDVAALPAVNKNFLETEAERTLYSMLLQKKTQLEQLGQQAQYTLALTSLAELQQPIDHFFAEVMVMVPDSQLRANRLALLHELRQLFLQVADISLLQS